MIPNKIKFFLCFIYFLPLFIYEHVLASTDTLKNNHRLLFKADTIRNPQTDLTINIINKDSAFNDLVFAGKIFFQGEFKHNADFTSATFENEIDFSKVKFDGIFFLDELKIDSNAKIQFYKASLPLLIDFYENKGINHIVDFTNADFDKISNYSKEFFKWHYINLFDSDIGKVKIDYQHFRLCFFIPSDFDSVIKKSLSITDSTVIFKNKVFDIDDIDNISKICIVKKYLEQVFPSASIKDSVVRQFIRYYLAQKYFPKRLSNSEVNAVYENVLKKFDLDGQKESYETLDIEYKYFKGDWFNIPYYWYCFGYHKELIFLWIAIFLFVFTGLTYRFYPILNQPFKNGIGEGVYYVKSIPVINDSLNIKSYRKKRILYSFWYTAIIFCMLTLKIENLNVSKRASFYIILIYSVGLLCVGYLANFILQK